MKKVFIPFIVIAALTGFMLAGCQKAPPSGTQKMKNGAQQFGQGASEAGKQLANSASSAGSAAKQNLSDSAITAKVKAALASNAGLRSLGLHVSTSHGVVTLSGTVNQASRKTLAAQVAGQVSGVEKVVNQIQVQGSGG